MSKPNRMKYPLNVPKAEELVDETNISCKTCNDVAIEGEEYCIYCKSYWEDIKNGLFDDDFTNI